MSIRFKRRACPDLGATAPPDPRAASPGRSRAGRRLGLLGGALAALALFAGAAVAADCPTPTPVGEQNVVQFANDSDTLVLLGVHGPSAVVPREGTWELPPGGCLTLDIPLDWHDTTHPGDQGPRFWARTGCHYDPTRDIAQCETGDCGGRYDCSAAGLAGVAPATLGEFCFNCGNGLNFWDVSAVDGVNLSLDIQPLGTHSGDNPFAPGDPFWCVYPNAVPNADLRENCPDDFQLRRSQLSFTLPEATDEVVACFSNCGRYEYPTAPAADCLDSDPNCAPWRQFCCQAGDYHQTCSSDSECSYGGACWEGKCACRGFLVDPPCPGNVCTNQEPSAQPPYGQCDAPGCIGDDTVHAVLPAAYSWPNDPQTYDCDARIFRVTFAPGGSPVPISPAAEIPLCSSLPTDYGYTAANQLCSGVTGRVFGGARAAPEVWDCDVDGATTGVLCRWESIAKPDISVSIKLDMGSVPVGGTSARTLRITNRGNAALALTGLALPGSDFSYTDPPTSIVAGANRALPLTFSPQGPGARTSVLTLISNDADESPFEVTLSGFGTTAANATRQTLNGSKGLEEHFVISDLTQANGAIVGFTSGEDKLDVSAMLAALGYKGQDPFADGTLTFTARRGSIYVMFDPDGKAGPRRAVTLTRLDGLPADAVALLSHDVTWKTLGSIEGPNSGLKPRRIRIYNNDPTHTIYPVLSTGTAKSSLWLRARFGVLKKDADAALDKGAPLYPKLNQFRIYINPKTGIKKDEYVELTLPLITQLVPDGDVKVTETDQYIDWWGGGRVELFAGPKDGAAPDELKNLHESKPGQTKVYSSDPNDPTHNALPHGVTGLSCTICKPDPAQPDQDLCRACDDGLEIHKDPAAINLNSASQLTEYTLGTINQNNDPPTIGDYTGAVDIDVSYVDTAYLPAAASVLNPRVSPIAQVGYVGTIISIDDFRTAIGRFLNAFPDWPQFKDASDSKFLKLSSTAHATTAAPDPLLFGDPESWTPIKRLTTQWQECINEHAGESEHCKDVRAVRAMFLANYQNYKDNVFGHHPPCDQDVPLQVLDDDDKLMIEHVYGFTPFNDHCDETSNLLEKTPGYAENQSARFHEVKKIYDGLEYLHDGWFNPWVLLLHDTDYVGAPNVYAYSVDDAVGNLQGDGDGFVIAIGGVRGLPNPNPAAAPVQINFGSENEFGDWIKYGICTTNPDEMLDVDPHYRSIALHVQEENLAECPLSLMARWKPNGEQVVYSFKLKHLNFQPWKGQGLVHVTEETHEPIDCGGLEPIPAALCTSIYAYSEPNAGRGPDALYVITPAVDPHGASPVAGAQAVTR